MSDMDVKKVEAEKLRTEAKLLLMKAAELDGKTPAIDAVDVESMREFVGCGEVVAGRVKRGMREVGLAVRELGRIKGGADTETYQRLVECRDVLDVLDTLMQPVYTVRL